VSFPIRSPFLTPIMKQIQVLAQIALGTLVTPLAASAADPPNQNPASSDPSVANLPATNSAGPRIQFFEVAHNFGTVDSGAVVKFDYIFTNTGNALLEITSVRPACGCTGAGEFDKRVEPGKTGKIPIQFRTQGFGEHVMKTVTVDSNDPAVPEVTLRLTGTVFRPIVLIPQSAAFTPWVDSVTSETRSVKIISNLDEPLTLSDLRCTNRAFRAELKTLREGKEFEVQVTALPPFLSANRWTPIMLKTSTARMPEITVNCYLNVQPVIAVIPNQITLPPGRLPDSSPYHVNINNNGTNSLALSDPVINVEGAKLQIHEVQPGRMFSLTATFPAGFQSRLGQVMEASVKSNHPKYPILKIPILQMPGSGDDAVPDATTASTSTNASSSATPLPSTAPQTALVKPGQSAGSDRPTPTSP
jgi:hypothetical protein